MRSTLLPTSRVARRRLGASTATRGTAAIAAGATLVAGSGGVVLSLLASTDAGAAPSDLIVSNLLDNSNPGSLRHAIEYSNANGGGAITVQSGLTGTINLTSNLPDITNPISITGPGSGSLAVDGGDTFQMFDTDTAPLTISGLTLTNAGGNQATIRAGRFTYSPYLNVHAPLALSDVVISSNDSRGGISSSNIPIGNHVASSLTNCVITGNNGSGISTVEVNWTITGSAISYNNGNGLSVTYGSSFSLSDSDVKHNNGTGIQLFESANNSITNVEAAHNSASSVGGGLAMRRPGISTVTDSSFHDNSAGAAGGGVQFYDGSVTFTRVSISGNSSNQGGGVFVGSGSTANFVDSVIADNSASSNGGGISGVGGITAATITLTNSSVSGNAANGGGGGISLNNAQLYTENAEISNNDGNHASGTATGGGVSLTNARAEFVSSVLDGNSAYAGGGVRVSSSTVNVLYSAITSNTATQGGALSITSQSTVSVNHSLLANNNGILGGALWSDISSTTLNNSTITGNHSTSYSVARLLGGSFLIVEESTIALNSDTSDPATEAISGQGATTSFTSSILWGNTRNNTNEIGDSSNSSVPTITNSIVDFHGTIVDGGGNLDSDPLLASLADNGGQTDTMALTYGSPALDAGSTTSTSAFDQRGAGFTRKIGSNLDIGAYEAQTPPTPPTSSTTTTIPNGGGGSDPADGGSGSGSLPVTGVEFGSTLAGGAVLLLGGGLLAGFARRNRKLI